MAALNRLREGQVLYAVSHKKMRNASAARLAVHPIRVVSVDLATRQVTASCNGKRARVFGETQVAGWKVNKPVERGLVH